MNIDTSSVIKAGGIAAAVGIVLGILSGIPLLGCLFAPLACLGFFLLPLGAGMGYGYYAPGKETMQQSAIGGALAGAFGGVVFGLISGIMSALTNAAGMAAYLEDLDVAASTAAGGFVGVICGAVLFAVGGLIFGAIGGVLWPLIQGNRTV